MLWTRKWVEFSIIFSLNASNAPKIVSNSSFFSEWTRKFNESLSLLYVGVRPKGFQVLLNGLHWKTIVRELYLFDFCLQKKSSLAFQESLIGISLAKSKFRQLIIFYSKRRARFRLQLLKWIGLLFLADEDWVRFKRSANIIRTR